MSTFLFWILLHMLTIRWRPIYIFSATLESALKCFVSYLSRLHRAAHRVVEAIFSMTAQPFKKQGFCLYTTKTTVPILRMIHQNGSSCGHSYSMGQFKAASMGLPILYLYYLWMSLLSKIIKIITTSIVIWTLWIYHCPPWLIQTFNLCFVQDIPCWCEQSLSRTFNTLYTIFVLIEKTRKAQ